MGKSNLWLAAQRANVPPSQAALVIAKTFPDPVLTAGLASLDVSGVGAQNNLTVVSGWWSLVALETGGVKAGQTAGRTSRPASRPAA